MRVPICPLLLLLTAVSAPAQPPAIDLSQVPYPEGELFPLGLYSLNPDEDMPIARQAGWNIAHTYHFSPAFLDTAAAAGLSSLAPVGTRGAALDEQADKQAIAALSQNQAVAWWDLPEELRYWREDEWAKVTNLSAWTRELDPRRRPNYMYLPGHYGPEAIARYVPYLDIIGTGCYTEYVHQPRSWVRWRIETQIEAIERAGFTVGRDYLHGQRVPIGVLMMFYEEGNFGVITAVEAYHDFYSAICAGARGIFIFSYWHKRDTAPLQETYEAYAKAAGEISGPEQLGKVFLFGEPYSGAGFQVTSGPAMGAPFKPYGYDHELRYPSVNVRALKWNGDLYVLAVSSAEQGIKGHLTGLPEGATEAQALFETVKTEGAEGTTSPRRLPITDGALEDSFGWLGVHIYKIAGAG